MPDLKKIAEKMAAPGAMLRLTFSLAVMALTLNAVVSWHGYSSSPLREAASRSLFASGSRWFFDSGLAEPLPVAALKAAMAVGADPDTALRLEGLATMFLLAVATVFVLRQKLGNTAATMALLFFGANPYLGYYAMQGSSHLYALVFLLLFWHWSSPPERSLRAALAAGAFAGLACLCRLDAAWAVLIICAFNAARGGLAGLRDAGIALGVALVLTLPYAAYQRAQYGNALYAQEVSLGRWADLARYGYGPRETPPSGPLSPAAFLLRDGPAGALKSAFYGLGRTLAYELPRVVYYRLAMFLAFLGAYAAFALKKDAPLVFLAAALLPVLPLAPIRQASTGGIEPRYYLWTLWALCALAGLGLQETLAWSEARLLSKIASDAAAGAALRKERKRKE
jgi:hypothetical protein